MAESLKDNRERWVRIKNECFDESGNYIEPPVGDNCGSAFVKLAGLSGVEESIKTATEEEIKLYKKAEDLYSRNIELSNNKTLELELQKIKENIEEVETIKNNLSNTQTNNTGTDTNNSNQNINNNSINTESDRLTIDELISLNNQGNNDLTPETNQPIPDDKELNVLAFQDKAFENIFVKNESADILNMSADLENTLLVFRDTCCGGKTTINGTETFRNSFNVSDIYNSDNSFLIEKSFTDGYGANSWNSLNRLVENNTYPDQNLLDITEYLDCRDARSNWTRWSCNKPSNYRDIEGRYYNTERKGVNNNDLIKGQTYLGEIKGLETEVIYQNNSWIIKNT